MERAFNKNTIEKIVLIDFTEAKGWYKYKKEIKFFGIVLQKKGVYNYANRYVGASINNHIIKDGKLFELPCVTIRFCSRVQQDFYFETFEEAEIFYNDLISKDTFIEY